MKFSDISFFIFILFLSITTSSLYAQNDSVRIKEEIIHIHKPLQFGNDFFPMDSFLIDQEIPKNLQPTQFTQIYTFKYLTYDPVRDPKRLLYNTSLYFGAAFTAFAILWISPESFSGWDKDKIKEDGFLKGWKENVKAGPVWDDDDWVLNWISHPWAGAVYYMSARGSGFKRWESFVYSIMMSTLFWEYGIEAFAEIPSWQDLIITPIVGSLLGEAFFIWKGKVIQNERKILNSRFLGGTSLFIMDPFNELLDVFGYKTQNKIQMNSTIAPISYDFSSGKAIWGMQVVVVF